MAQCVLGPGPTSHLVTRASVAVVSTYYRPVLGGAEAAAERLATFLHRRGHPVVVLTKRTSVDCLVSENIDGVDIERLAPTGERNGYGKWVVLPSLVNALLQRRKSIDLICCVDYRGIGLAALFAGSAAGTPVVFQAQTEGVLSGSRVREWLKELGVRRDGALANIATWPMRALYGRADAIGCISRGIEREAIDAGIPRERVHYLPNPVDTRLFAPATPDEKRALRERLGVAPGSVLVTFVGRLSREKGVMELVRAWARAKPHAQLVLIGPPMTDHPWDVSHEAKALVDEEGIGDAVRFLGGQPIAMVAAWLRASDFSVQPSHFEAMGLAAAEAMAAGLPVIASDTGGYRDFVTHEQTGLLVPPGDVEALAAAITRLADDSALRSRLGAKARDVAEQFDERVVLERFAQLIEQLAAAR